MLRKIINVGVVLYVVIAVALLAWFGRGYFMDESPAEGRDAFYQTSQQQIPDARNLAVAIAGLAAPQGADTIVYGRQAIQQAYQASKHKPASQNGTAKLEVAWLTDEQLIDCAQPNAIPLREYECASTETIGQIIERNQTLLNRYYALYAFSDWQGPAIDIETLMRLNRVLGAQNKLLAHQQQAEKAFEQWLRNHRFIQRALQHISTFEHQYIFQSLYGLSLNQLAYLTHHSPQLLDKHRTTIDNLLTPQVFNDATLKPVLIAEYQQLNELLSNQQLANSNLKLERFRNRMYQFHQQTLGIAKLAFNEYKTKYDAMMQTYRYRSKSPLQTLLKSFMPYATTDALFDIFIAGSPMGPQSLMEQMHSNNATIHLLRIRNQLKHDKVAPSEIGAFLQNTSKHMHCPFTQRPMKYDKRNQTLYCKNPDNNERVAEVRLLP